MRRRRCAAVLVAAVLVLALGGCVRKTDAGQRITIGVGGQTLPVYLPLTLAERLGYFGEEGLWVDIQGLQGGSKALQALEGGSLDVVAGYYDHTIQMQAKRRALTSFVTMLNRPEIVLAVSPAASKPITSIADLAGANVGVSAPGSSTDFFLKYVLSKHGVAADAVSVQAIGTAATAVAAMEHGRVDAAVMVDPAFSTLQQRAGADKVTILLDSRSGEGVEQTFGVAKYPASVLYSTRAWLDDNGQAATRLATAIVRALRWIQQHSAEEIAARMPAEFAQDNRGVYVETIAKIKSGFSDDGVMSADGAEAVRKVLAQFDQAVAGAEIDLSRTYSNDYLPGGDRG
ncbi:ABC transporter substrate-binding protein [Nocardia sp. NPDC052566]|uniref:ABC transporter substrate-binding protein n=1 Tax=Nocardia sp. NPDC052566 TaxID=3364330 RepID=UPI0037CCB910